MYFYTIYLNGLMIRQSFSFKLMMRYGWTDECNIISERRWWIIVDDNIKMGIKKNKWDVRLSTIFWPLTICRVNVYPSVVIIIYNWIFFSWWSMSSLYSIVIYWNLTVHFENIEKLEQNRTYFKITTK